MKLITPDFAVDIPNTEEMPRIGEIIAINSPKYAIYKVVDVRHYFDIDTKYFNGWRTSRSIICARIE